MAASNFYVARATLLFGMLLAVARLTHGAAAKYTFPMLFVGINSYIPGATEDQCNAACQKSLGPKGTCRSFDDGLCGCVEGYIVTEVGNADTKCIRTTPAICTAYCRQTAAGEHAECGDDETSLPKTSTPSCACANGYTWTNPDPQSGFSECVKVTKKVCDSYCQFFFGGNAQCSDLQELSCRCAPGYIVSDDGKQCQKATKKRCDSRCQEGPAGKNSQCGEDPAEMLCFCKAGYSWTDPDVDEVTPCIKSPASKQVPNSQVRGSEPKQTSRQSSATPKPFPAELTSNMATLRIPSN